MRVIYSMLIIILTTSLSLASDAWWEQASPEFNHNHSKSMDSTQKEAERILRGLEAKGEPLTSSQVLLFTADQQTAGIGSGERKWESPIGNLYATFVFPWPKECFTDDNELYTTASLVPQIAALSACQTLEGFGLKAELKWVNDILLEGKKNGGVLCGLESNAVLVGIGINVNMDESAARDGFEASTSDKMRVPFGSMKIASRGTGFDIDAVLERLKTILTRNLAKLLTTKSFGPFYREIDARLAYKGELVIYSAKGDGSDEKRAKILGINNFGHLRIQEESYAIKEVFFGRIRPILE